MCNSDLNTPETLVITNKRRKTDKAKEFTTLVKAPIFLQVLILGPTLTNHRDDLVDRVFVQVKGDWADNRVRLTISNESSLRKTERIFFFFFFISFIINSYNRFNTRSLNLVLILRNRYFCIFIRSTDLYMVRTQTLPPSKS